MARTARPTKPTHEEYVFGVSDPSLSYSLAIADRRSANLHEEHATLLFAVECLSPARHAGRLGTATLWPEPALADPKLLEQDDVLRRWIGYVRAARSTLEVSLYLPPPALWRIGQAIALGLVRTLLTNGLVEPRGMNRVTSFSFRGSEFDPAEYLG